MKTPRLGALGIALWLLAAACGAGSLPAGTPEEALEAFNGHMAARDFASAAAYVYFECWDHTPGQTPAERRAQALESLAWQYDHNDLDYNRAEVTGRGKPAEGFVTLAVAYRKRSAPAGGAATWSMTFKRCDDGWRYFIPVPPDSPGQE